MGVPEGGLTGGATSQVRVGGRPANRSAIQSTAVGPIVIAVS